MTISYKDIMKQHELFKSIYESNLKSRAVNVMSCLITYMNTNDNTCFPSIKTIAKCCSISVNTVKRALDDLVSAGFVEKEARFIEEKNGAQTSNLYHLSIVFTELEPSKNKPIAKDRDKRYEVIAYEDLKSQNNINDRSLEQMEDTQIIPTHDKLIPITSIMERGILRIKHYVSIISINMREVVPNTQLSNIPP